MRLEVLRATGSDRPAFPEAWRTPTCGTEETPGLGFKGFGFRVLGLDSRDIEK